MADLIQLSQQFVKLTREKRALSAQVNQLNEQLEQIETQLTDAFTQAGVQNVNVEGMTVYISKMIWAKARFSPVKAIHTLERAGLGDLVTLGVQKVSAYFRGTDPSEIPPAVKRAFELEERYSIGAREAK